MRNLDRRGAERISADSEDYGRIQTRCELAENAQRAENNKYELKKM